MKWIGVSLSWLAVLALLPLLAFPGAGSPPGSGADAVPLPPEVVLDIGDFESGAPGWEAYWEASTSTTISCAAEAGTGSRGTGSLRIDYSVAPGGWANCSLLFDSPQNWSAAEWLSYEIHSDRSGLPFNVILYGGTPDGLETYLQPIETPVEYPGGYIPFMTWWNEFLRVDWEEGPGLSFEHPEQVSGLGFGFDGVLPEAAYTGTLWVDNIKLEKSPTYATDTDQPKSGLPCLGSLLLPLTLVGLALFLRRH